MALVPSWQLYLDSLHSPFSKFRCTRLHLLRYSNSSSLERHGSSSSNPLRKSLSFEKPSCRDVIKVSALASSDRFPLWSKPIKDSRPKPPGAVLDEDGGDGRGRTMERIVENLRESGCVDEAELARGVEKGSVEEILYVEEEEMMPNEKPRKEEQEGEKWMGKTKIRTSLAESTLPDSELKRMRNLTYRTKSRVKVRSGKVTEEVVSGIRDKWKTSEIVRVRVDGGPALNMKKVHQILERKTGGLVVLRSGTTIGLYRGVNYEVPSVLRDKKISRRTEIAANSLPADTINTLGGPTTVYSTDEIRDVHLDSENTAGEGSSTAMEKKHIKSHSEVHYKDEIDKLLDGLGPRYMDWPGYKPLPVDADMLPGLVPGFQPPFRLLPYGVKQGLTQKDATSLRRSARFLTPHFALGRSNQLQGLATAMVILWEKSLVAKIALKRGVPITTSERMAEDLKKLTGGTLLVRTHQFFVFYRGKSFLSPDVSEALMEKERLGKTLQDEEEQARLRASAFVYTKH